MNGKYRTAGNHKDADVMQAYDNRFLFISTRVPINEQNIKRIAPISTTLRFATFVILIV